jgi:hypothetical protein
MNRIAGTGTFDDVGFPVEVGVELLGFGPLGRIVEQVAGD